MPRPVQLGRLPRLLIVDDDEISRDVMQMTFEMHGFTAATAEDGKGALEHLGQPGSAVDLILMDTQMPGLSGVALVDALRRASEAPILAISASEPGEAVRAAADGFLLKPVQPEALLAWLQSADDDATAGSTLSFVDAAAADENDGSLVDPVVLGKLQAMMPATAVREIYAAVASDLETRLATLEAAMQAGDGAEVARIAHAIKGGCAMVGVTSARETASRLETSNLPVTWSNDLAQLLIALRALEGMLGGNFPA